MLNQCQKKALKAIQLFLVNPTDKFFCLCAASGFGKSFLINHVIAGQARFLDTLKIMGVNDFPYNTIQMTATTNKATSLLDDAETIFRLIGIKPTWNNKLTDKWAKTVTQEIVIIDEASYISEELFDYICTYCVNCKIIFVGDRHQLKAVGSKFSVFEQGFATTSLATPMRQDPDSDLYKLCDHLRDCVEKGIAPTWFKGEGITFHNGQSYVDEITKAFLAEEDCKVVAYKNVTVDSYNAAIMEILGKKSMFEVGTKLISKKYVPQSIHTAKTYPGQEVTVMKSIETQATNQYTTIDVVLMNGIYRIPQGAWYRNKLASLKHAKNWSEFYPLSEIYHDFSLGYALTSYKAQGSTYDKVFLDLRDIDTCYDLDEKLRQIYVGVSRARKEVHIFV